MGNDTELLRRYVEERSEEAFAELVRLHLNLVYYAALRQVGGDVHRAQDVTQVVFTDLARKAPSLTNRATLTGWLHTSTRFAAAMERRADLSREKLKRESETMREILQETASDVEWERLCPLVDDVIHGLNDRDREAVLMRFFEGLSFASIGATFALSEDAARMRVERALEKMRVLLARRGVTSTTTALAVALANPVSLAAPAGLAATVTSAALAGSAVGAGGWLAAFMSISKLQMGIAGALAAAGATGFVMQAEANAGLRREIAALREQQQVVAALRVENKQLASAVAEVEILRRDDAELARLSQKVSEAQRAQKEQARLASGRDRERWFQQEVDRMNREGNALVAEYKSLSDKSNEPLLTVEAKAEIQAAMKQKMEAIWTKQREVRAFTENNGSSSTAAASRNQQVNPVRPSYGGTITARPSAPGQDEPTKPSPPPSWSFKFVPRP